MNSHRKVERCRLCGAPLKNPTTAVVTCLYCEADNRLDLSGFAAEHADTYLYAEAARQAAVDAEALIPEIERRAEELHAEMMRAVEALHAERDEPSRQELRREAARLFEAYFRLHQRPGLLVAAAAGPAGEEMLRRVDEAVPKAVKSFLDGLP